MKKLLIAITLAAGLSTCVYGQGTIILDNSLNTSLDSAATSNGLIWTNDGKGGIGLWDGSQYNLSVTALAGPSSDSLSPLITVLESDPRYTGWAPGQILVTWVENLTLTIPGIAPGGSAWLNLKLWWSAGGPIAPTYEAAKASGTSFFGEALWLVPSTGNPVVVPPTLPADLRSMPAIVLMVPEPSMFALAGLGLAGLLIFRRRK